MVNLRHCNVPSQRWRDAVGSFAPGRGEQSSASPGRVTDFAVGRGGGGGVILFPRRHHRAAGPETKNEPQSASPGVASTASPGRPSRRPHRCSTNRPWLIRAHSYRRWPNASFSFWCLSPPDTHAAVSFIVNASRAPPSNQRHAVPHHTALTSSVRRSSGAHVYPKHHRRAPRPSPLVRSTGFSRVPFASSAPRYCVPLPRRVAANNRWTCAVHRARNTDSPVAGPDFKS